MNKTLTSIALIALMFVTGCSRHHDEYTADYDLPPELKDCKVFYIAPDGMGTPLNVIYCPGKTTIAEEYSVGKTHRDVDVVTDPAPAATVGASSAQFSDDTHKAKTYACKETDNGTLSCVETH